MPYPLFDRSRLRIRPLAERDHDLNVAHVLRLVAARQAGAARILMMGAHVLRAGVQRHLIDLLERGLIDHVAMNGAGPIHDWELALIGATTESVARYVSSGEFGLWHETGRINDVIRAAARDGLGLGEAAGRAILTGDFPHK